MPSVAPGHDDGRLVSQHPRADSAVRGGGGGEGMAGVGGRRAGGSMLSNYVLRDVDHHITVAWFYDERAGGRREGVSPDIVLRSN